MGKSKRSINPKSSVSIPTQLRDFILQDIASEVYKPGERLDPGANDKYTHLPFVGDEPYQWDYCKPQLHGKDYLA